MTVIQAIALGVIQGLTEFLPVSSSGHLVLFQHLFGLRQPELIFDVAVHIGTLTAVCIYFYHDLIRMITALAKWVFGRNRNAGFKNPPADVWLALMILAGTVPTAIIGLFFHGIADVLFSSVLLVGGMLVGTGIWMWFTRYKTGAGKDVSGLSLMRAVLIGIAQGVAVIPGVSRSGATIAAALYLGLNRETAARYSFLLSIPAILGAALVGLPENASAGNAGNPAVLAGAVSAAAVGYAALSFLVYLVKKGHLSLFAPYCWVVGGIVLMLAW